MLYAKAEGDFTARTKFLIYKEKGSDNSVGYMRAKLGAAVHELGGTEG